MGQTAVTIRLDSSTKQQLEVLCKEFGMSVNTAFNIFARSVVRNRRIPFEIQADSKAETVRKAREAILQMRKISETNGNAEMSLDEINSEIMAVRNLQRCGE